MPCRDLNRPKSVSTFVVVCGPTPLIFRAEFSFDIRFAPFRRRDRHRVYYYYSLSWALLLLLRFVLSSVGWVNPIVMRRRCTYLNCAQCGQFSFDTTKCVCVDFGGYLPRVKLKAGSGESRCEFSLRAMLSGIIAQR